MPYPTSAEIALLRSRQRNFSRIYLGVQKGKERTDSPPPLMVGQHYALVAADTYDADEHHLTFNAANFLDGSNIRPGMTMAVGTLADPFLYGSARIRTVDAGNNRICLERNNLDALGYIAAGNYIWVDGVYRLYRKLPYIVAGVIYEDGNPDTALAAAGIPGYGIAWNANYVDRPVALMGSPRFAWAGEPINFYGWRSYGRGGNNITGYAWDFDGGIVAGGADVSSAGSLSDPVVVTWNAAGEYVASLIVSDDSGKVGNDAYGIPFTRHRAVRPVLVYDKPGEGDNPPYTDLEVESLSGKYGSGWTARIKVFNTADKSEFPDNALIILFAADWYGGTKQSIGEWYGQEGILFIGHIRSGSVRVDFEKSTVTFEAQTIEQWMKDINVWPANFVDPSAAASAWREFDDMVVEDVLWYLAEFSSNLKDVTDCFFSGGQKALHFLDLTENSLYDQMSGQIGSCFFGQVSASRQGSIHLFKHKNMMTLAERLVYGSPFFTFTTQDWHGELNIGEERQRDSVAQIDFIGFIYDAGGNPQEVYSLAPLRQLNFGTIEKVTGTLLTGQTIAAAQAENDTLSGLYLAWKNIRFPNLGIPAFNNRVLEPALQDYFAVELAEADSIRGYIWNAKEFLTIGMSIDIDNENGIILSSIEGEASTWGPDGVAGEYPPGTRPPTPPGDSGGGGPPEYWPPPPPEETPEGSLLYLLSGTRMYRTRNARAAAAAVVYEDLGLVDPASGGLFWFALDSWDPQNSAMACGENGIYKTTNLDSASPTWTQVLDLSGDAAQITWAYHIVSSICQRDLWMCTVLDYSAAPAVRNLYAYWTINGGTTWSSTLISAAASYNRAYIEASSHNAQVAWVTYMLGTDAFGYVAKTTDQWSSFTATQLTLLGAIANIPNCYHRYFGNPSDSVGLYISNTASQICTNDYLSCTTGVINSGLASPITNWVGGYTWGTAGFWALTRSTAAPTSRFHISNNGSTWTLQYTWPADRCYCMSGWPYASGRFYGGMASGPAPFEYSEDEGATWTAQTGNWAAFGPDAIYCLVPVWTV